MIGDRTVREEAQGDGERVVAADAELEPLASARPHDRAGGEARLIALRVALEEGDRPDRALALRREGGERRDGREADREDGDPLPDEEDPAGPAPVEDADRDEGHDVEGEEARHRLEPLPLLQPHDRCPRSGRA